MEPSSIHTRDLFAFDMVHPSIQLAYFALLLIFCMTVMQPIYVGITFIGALVFSVYARGVWGSLRILAMQIPLIVLIAIINPLFSGMGSTELFRIGARAVYAESLAFGICMGFMFASVMLWFSNATRVLSSDKVMAVFGNFAPTVGLMISMAMSLVPRFVDRGNQIAETARACAFVQPQTNKARIEGYARLASVLMGWSMESSLETADAMRARGWGASTKRTNYRRYHFRLFDAGIAIAGGVLVALNALLAWVALSQYLFYPMMSDVVMWWGYVPYALFVLLPVLVCLIDDMKWRQGA